MQHWHMQILVQKDNGSETCTKEEVEPTDDRCLLHIYNEMVIKSKGIKV
jgi:hypothetical protein